VFIGPSGEIPVAEFRRDDLVMATTLPLPSAGAYLGVLSGSVRLNAMNGKDFTSYLRDFRFGPRHCCARRGWRI
jgi:hypothetical protein